MNDVNRIYERLWIGNGNICQVCRVPASTRCTGCLNVAYCCKEHQKSDWINHQNNCILYKMQRDDTLGRYWTARRSIKRGEVVLREKPIVRGPAFASQPVCLGCLNALKMESCVYCGRCGLPHCSVNCAMSQSHEPECEMTRVREKKKIVVSDSEPDFFIITILRLLSMKKSNPFLWTQMSDLESHCENRKKDEIREVERVTVAKYLRKHYKLAHFPEELILRLCGILQVNGHELPLSSPSHLGLYYYSSFFEHSCFPNCSKSFSDDGEIIIRAAVDIAQGDHLSIAYTDTLWHTLKRRTHLKVTKYFDCNCVRCLDPTEFGTNFSAIRCQSPSCSGVVLPESFLYECPLWKCTKCSYRMPLFDVHYHITGIVNAIEVMDKLNINTVKAFLNDYAKKFPPNFTFVVKIKFGLAHMIGQLAPGYAIVDDETLDFKEKLCRELLSLAHTLFRCGCRLIGVLHFELHVALGIKALRLINKYRSSVNQGVPLWIKKLVLDSATHLEEAIFCLKYEPKAMMEGRLLERALVRRVEFSNLFKSLDLPPLTSRIYTNKF